MQITDRSKDVIKSGGEWIGSIDLENIAMAHPCVSMAACIAAKHAKWDERQLAATYTGLMFRSMRFGINEAHGRGTAVQWNWFREKGFVTGSSDGHYAADFTRFREAVRSLASELLTIEATGDYARAEALLGKYGTLTPEISGTIAKLTDIPVDITPVFTAAGEQ